MSGLPDSLTSDTLFNGRLICRQHREGYRFSVDSMLVAHFCRPGKASRRVLDLGTGSGIISLILAYRHPGLDVIGLEIQTKLADLAADNARANNFAERVEIINGDLRYIKRLVQAESFDLVVSNPPYGTPGRGRVNPLTERARARHEIDAELDDIVKAASFGVKNRGTAVFVYPAVRATRLLVSLQKFKFSPKKLQAVYSYPEDDRARLVLVEAVKNGGEELRILPPFYIYSAKNGAYSEEMQKIYE